MVEVATDDTPSRMEQLPTACEHCMERRHENQLRGCRNAGRYVAEGRAINLGFMPRPANGSSRRGSAAGVDFTN